MTRYMLTKSINFSSATTPGMAQYSIEAKLYKSGGKNLGPPNRKKMTTFFDDVHGEIKHLWSYGSFYFLNKDKRGGFKFKSCEDLYYLAACSIQKEARTTSPTAPRFHPS